MKPLQYVTIKHIEEVFMLYIGVDLGGTNVRAAMVNAQGEVLQVVKEATKIAQGVQAVVQQLKDLIQQLDGYEKVQGIGLGVPGLVDAKNGVMILSNNLPGFEGLEIAKEIQETFDKPTFIDNDVNVAGLGESYFGAAKGERSVYYVTISTGIGGAFIYEGKLISGSHGCAGEMCNMVVDPTRTKIGGLNAGALESEASGTALTRKGKVLFPNEVKHAGDVFRLAQEGNTQAQELVEQMAKDIAHAFSFVALTCDPDAFVVGGGVTQKSHQYFFEKMIAYYKELVFPTMRDVKFYMAKLEEPGIVGAAMLVTANMK